MIDLHTHLLPNLDDGPRTLQESIDLINMAKKDGITDIVLTPHRFKSKDLNVKPDDIKKAYNTLKKQVNNINLYIGSDITLTSNLDQLLDPKDSTLFINDSNYFLLELHEDILPPNISDLLYKIQLIGLIPIITHPERCIYFQDHPEILVPFIDKGILIQLTADSFFDSKTKNFADTLIMHNMVHFISSDAHSKKRPPTLSKTYKYISKNFSPETSEALFILNPKAVLENNPIPVFPEAIPFEPRGTKLQNFVNKIYGKFHKAIIRTDE